MQIGRLSVIFSNDGHLDKVLWNCIKIAAEKSTASAYLCAHTCNNIWFLLFFNLQHGKMWSAAPLSFKGILNVVHDTKIYSKQKKWTKRKMSCLYDNHFRHFSFAYRFYMQIYRWWISDALHPMRPCCGLQHRLHFIFIFIFFCLKQEKNVQNHV